MINIFIILEVAMNLICIDASIQSSGVSIYNNKTEQTILYSYSNKIKEELNFESGNFIVNIVPQTKESKKMDTFGRYVHVAETIYNKIQPYLAQESELYMEGYSYASRGMVFNIGEFGALLKLPFYKDGYQFNFVEPASWKKLVTGKGNANKTVVYDTMLSSELNVVLAEFICRGHKYKKGTWIEDIVDVYSIQKFVLSKEG